MIYKKLFHLNLLNEHNKHTKILTKLQYDIVIPINACKRKLINTYKCEIIYIIILKQNKNGIMILTDEITCIIIFNK